MSWILNLNSDQSKFAFNDENIAIVNDECIDVFPYVVNVAYAVAFVLVLSIWVNCASKWIDFSMAGRYCGLIPTNEGTTHLDYGDLTTGVQQIKVVVRQIFEQLQNASNQKKQMRSEIESLKQLIEHQRQMYLEDEIPLHSRRFQNVQTKIGAIESAMAEHGNLLKQHLEMSLKSVTERNSYNKHVENEPNIDNESSKSITVALKRTMGEFLQDAKNQLAKERSEVMADTREMFTQIIEERNEIVCLIHGAMQTFTQQSVQCYQRTGEVGQDAIHCVEILHERLEVNAIERLSKFDSRLNQLFEHLKSMNVDVGALKTALDSVDAQIDNVYHRLELSHQKNTEEATQIFNCLKGEAEEWSKKTAQLGNVVDQIYSLVEEAKHATKSAETSQREMVLSHFPELEGQLSSMTEDILTYKQNFDQGMVDVLPSMLSICFNKLNTLGSVIDEETADIQTIMTDFKKKLGDLFCSAEGTVESFEKLQLTGGGEGDPQHNKVDCLKNKSRITSVIKKKSPSSKRTPKVDAISNAETSNMSPANLDSQINPEIRKSKIPSAIRKIPSSSRKSQSPSRNCPSPQRKVVSSPKKIRSSTSKLPMSVPTSPNTPSSSPKRNPKKIAEGKF